MALKGTEVGTILVIVALMWNGAAAQSGCTRVLMSLSPCLNYVTGNSSTPSSSCCSQLSSVVQSQPQCLCSLLNGGSSSLGITVNQTLALALPGACDVQTPPVSRCNAASGPTASADTPRTAPVGSAESTPSDSSNQTPGTPETPSNSDTPYAGAGSKTVPSIKGGSANGASGGSTIKLPLHVVVFLLFVGSFVSTGTRF
ncbi:non-specific lipid transfer protein GPI-anchored 5-like [Diospyros lotus]|uniref:non-specific lipid transfer protein GPI-anchored 5-like n=1 Tax=Diospyros lotus TaxID=55363 RepID=UPI00224FFD4F|nr:non-specific lipid transfer protein GPI-anchored 5-like [Diospyros lotus]